MIRSRRAPPRAARGGFTLLELLAVVVLIGLISALVIPSLGVTTSRALTDRSRELAADLEFARQRTVMTGVPHRVVLDLDRGTWRVEWQPPPEEDAAPADSRTQDAIGRQGLDLSPPAQRQGEFQPLPTGQARDSSLGGELFFARVDTPAGPVDQGKVDIEFDRNGSADPTEIRIEEPDGFGRVLEVLPLADAVRVLDASAHGG